jgi:hypothetical protein
MTSEEARECFNQMAETFRANGILDKAAEIELCREYFTNPQFKNWLHDHLWINRDRG